MKQIVIDARDFNNHIKQLIYFLQEFDQVNQYTILVSSPGLFKTYNDSFIPHTVISDKEFKKIIKQLTPDLIHQFNPRLTIYKKYPTISTFYNSSLLLDEKNKLLKRLLKKKLIKYAQTSHHIITHSELNKTRLMHFAKIPSTKISTIYQGFDISIDNHKNISSKINQSIVCSYDNLNILNKIINAHQILLKKYPSLKLIIINRFNKKIQIDSYQNIQIINNITDKKLVDIYKQAMVYIHTNNTDDEFRCLQELAYEVPVLCSDTDCISEIYKNSVYYFNPKNTSDIIEKIDEVLSNEKLRKKLIKNGQKQLAKYSWKKMAIETLEIYNKVLAEE